MALRLHCLGIPHAVTTKEKPWITCAFSQKVLKFCDMMTKLGHIVYHYGHEDSEVNCSEHITVTTQEDMVFTYGDKDYSKHNFDFQYNDFMHQTFTKNASREVRKRAGQNDFLLCFFGTGHEPVAMHTADLPLIVVEPGIGYETTFAPFRVYESYSRLHQDIGHFDARNRIFHQFKDTVPDIANWNPNTYQHYTHAHWNDIVIPNYFDPDDFTYRDESEKEDYHMFIGRIIFTKGVDIAIKACHELGKKLLIAGQGWDNFESEYGFQPYGDYEYLGTIGVEERAEYMSKSEMGWIATRYPGPFEGVHAEFAFSGTPFVSTDWGVFANNVENGKIGYRCRSYEQFLWAAQNIKNVKSEDCRKFAMENYSMDRVSLMYHEYFENILRSIENNGNFWHLNSDRKDLDIYSVNVPPQNTEQRISELKPMREDGTYYHPGGSVAGGDSFLDEHEVFDYVIDMIKPNSVLDIGAGEGHTSKYFEDKECNVIAIDKDRDAIDNAVFPVSHHDLTRDKFVMKAMDLGICIEVLEHIPKKYLNNVANTFKQCKYLLITFAEPMSLGVGHINCQHEEYWVKWLESIGYVKCYSQSDYIRSIAKYPCFKNTGSLYRAKQIEI